MSKIDQGRRFRCPVLSRQTLSRIAALLFDSPTYAVDPDGSNELMAVTVAKFYCCKPVP